MQPVPGPPDLHPRRTRLELLPLPPWRQAQPDCCPGVAMMTATRRRIESSSSARRKTHIGPPGPAWYSDSGVRLHRHSAARPGPCPERGNTIGERVDPTRKRSPQRGTRSARCARAAKQNSMGAAGALPTTSQSVASPRWASSPAEGSNLTTDRGVFQLKKRKMSSWVRTVRKTPIRNLRVEFPSRFRRSAGRRHERPVAGTGLNPLAARGAPPRSRIAGQRLTARPPGLPISLASRRLRCESDRLHKDRAPSCISIRSKAYSTPAA